MSEDPYAVLGLSRGASKDEIKRAFREKALQTHPDLNAAQDAAAQYARTRKAAEALLYGTRQEKQLHRPPASYSSTLDSISRSPRFPMYFSAACLLGGCIIFAGALRAHTAVFDGYSYHIVEESDRRRSNPSPEQQRILSLLTDKKDRDALDQQ